MPEPRPWFPFYGKDWTASTRNLSAEAKGCYIDLLAFAWDNGGLPNDEEELRLIVGVDKPIWRRVWPKLQPRWWGGDGRLVNRRQERERTVTAAFQKAGRASAEARKRKHGTAQPPNVRPNDASNDSPNNQPNDSPNDSPNKSSTIASSRAQSQSQSQSHKQIPPQSPKGDALFDRFWSAYPLKEAKITALRAWTKLSVDDALLDRLLEAIARHKETDRWQRGIVPHPATWLNQRRWEDEKPSAATSDDNGDSDGSWYPIWNAQTAKPTTEKA